MIPNQRPRQAVSRVQHIWLGDVTTVHEPIAIKAIFLGGTVVCVTFLISFFECKAILARRIEADAGTELGSPFIVMDLNL